MSIVNKQDWRLLSQFKNNYTGHWTWTSLALDCLQSSRVEI